MAVIRQILGFFTIKGGPNIVIFVNKRRHRGSVQDGATIMIERPHIYLGWSRLLREVVLLAELLQRTKGQGRHQVRAGADTHVGGRPQGTPHIRGNHHRKHI